MRTGVDVTTRAQVVGDLFEGKDAGEIHACRLQSPASALLAVHQGDCIVDIQSEVTQMAGGFENGTATGNEIIDDQAGLPWPVDTLDHRIALFAWGVDIDHGHGRADGVHGAEVEATEGDSTNHAERLHGGIAHLHQRAEFIAHDPGAAIEHEGRADQAPDVDVDG